MPARYISVPATTTADILMVTGRIVLMGWSLYEDAGSPALASAVIRDGTTAAGALVAAIKMPLSGNSNLWLGDIDVGGIMLTTGLFFDMIAGSMSGAVYIG